MFDCVDGWFYRDMGDIGLSTNLTCVTNKVPKTSFRKDNSLKFDIKDKQPIIIPK